MTQDTPIRPEQVERLIAAAGKNRRDALLVRIPWRTGMRVTELIGIRVPDIDFDNRAIVIKMHKMRKRDGKAIERRRVVSIDQGTLDMVREYLEWKLRVCQDNESLLARLAELILDM